MLLICELLILSDLLAGKTFFFSKSISCGGAFFYSSSACPIGFRLSLCDKEQAQTDDYGKEFQ
jgi:hypothetical protein